MAFLEMFERVADHVRSRGAKLTFKRGRPVSADAIDEARSRSLAPWPEELAQFFTELGEVAEFGWVEKGRGTRRAIGRVSFARLSSCIVIPDEGSHRRIEWCDDYDFRFTKDPALAKQTAIKMRRWIPIITEGNGDSFCLDAGRQPAPVVLNLHDWFDGGSGDNGACVGSSLTDFLHAWSQVCFQCPSGLYWPAVLGNQGVDWSSDEFSAQFRL